MAPYHACFRERERGGGVDGVRFRILLPAPLTQAGQKPTTKHLTNIQNYKCKKLSGAAHANAWCKRMECARDADHQLDNHRVVTMHAVQSVPSAGKASCLFIGTRKNRTWYILKWKAKPSTLYKPNIASGRAVLTLALAPRLAFHSYPFCCAFN